MNLFLAPGKSRGFFSLSAVFVLFGIVSCSSAPPPNFDEAQWLESVKAEDISSLYAPHEKPDGTFFNEPQE